MIFQLKTDRGERTNVIRAVVKAILSAIRSETIKEPLHLTHVSIVFAPKCSIFYVKKENFLHLTGKKKHKLLKLLFNRWSPNKITRNKSTRD